MKCDELTPVTREYADEYWEDRFAMVYNADEVDAAIAELKAKLESVQATEYTESVDAGMENRKLKRALWLARAGMASNAAMFWHAVWTDEPSGCNEVYDIDFNVLTDKLKRRSFDWFDVFENVERKCRAKAEEYK